jgi:hypothetical protein
MAINAEFQMVCFDCGSLKIKIENPEAASRDAIVYCGHCGASRGTIGALRDLAVQPDPYPKLPRASMSPSFGGRSKKPKFPSQILEQFREFQSLRRRVQRIGSVKRTPPDISHSWGDPRKIDKD